MIIIQARCKFFSLERQFKSDWGTLTYLKRVQQIHRKITGLAGQPQTKLTVKIYRNGKN